MQVHKIPYQNVKGCVFKLFWGEKYIIIKCKTFARIKTNLETSLFYHLKTGMKDILYGKFFDYVKNSPENDFKVEILIQADNPYRLLIKEQEALNEAKNDLQCLNVVFDAYVPRGTQVNGKGSWINRGYYLNFMQWKRKQKQLK